MEKKYILAYDFGTSGVKAALVDFKGTLLGYEEKGYPLISVATGYAEQDPDAYWNAVCSATRAVIETTGVPADSIAGMAFGTQGMGIIPVDVDGNVLYNNITWIDSRAREQADEINNKIGAHVMDASDTLPKMLWFKQNEPELYAKTKYILDCTGFLNMKATGMMTSDYTGNAPYSPIPAMQEYMENMYRTAGMDLDKYAPLIPCTGYVGHLSEKAAKELGIATDTKLYMGVVDVTCAAVGAGCCKEGDVHLYLGTSGWITAIIGNEYVPNVSTGIYQLPSMNNSSLIYGGCVQSCCLAFNWTINEFYHVEKEELKNDIFKMINKEVEQVPAGSNGVLSSPWLMGERCPIMDEKTKGVFIGVSNLTTRKDLVNAMMESICYSLRMQMDYYKQDIGKWPNKVASIGGGSQSDHWMQMMADVLNTPVVRPSNCRHSGAIGSAAIVAVGMGICKADEIDSFVQFERTFEPIPENVAVYERYYKLWKELYPALKDTFAKLYDM